MSRGSVLFVDDEAEIRESAREWLTLSGFSVETAADGAAALAKLAARAYEVVITDVRMPGLDGMGLLAQARLRDPHQAVVLLTGHGDVAIAVEAMRAGAHDFLEKPYDADHLVAVLERAVAQRRLSAEVERLRLAAPGAELEDRFVGLSGAAAAVRARIAQLADLDVDILIQGETGTGKEVVARALHDLGRRRDRPFVALNCAAIPESVFESEIFGHDRGAFTGAAQRRVGRIEHAQGGTVFLDEIESMPMALQAKMLRVIQEREVDPLGSNRAVPLDIRFVAATKSDLSKMSESGNFRADLYFRLATVQISIPPLSRRRDDIALLFARFAAGAAARHGLAPREPDRALLASLAGRDWPGNVRELRAAAERHALGLPVTGDEDAFALEAEHAGGGLGLAARVAAYEADLIREALETSGGSAREASRLLDLPLRTLNEKIQRHGLRASRA